MSHSPFSIQFVGSGNAWSKPPANYNTNALVRSNGHAWLIDCGLLCPLALKDFGIPQETIEGVFVSHLHGDHVHGLEELLFRRFFLEKKTHNLWLPEPFFSDEDRYDGCHIWNNCLKAAMETFVNGREKPLELTDYAHIHKVATGNAFDIFDLPCEIFEVEHTANKPSFGIILDNRVAFTSDTQFSRTRITQLLDRGIQTIFHEVSFYPPFAGNIHTAFEELASLPRDVAEHIVLMHYADSTNENDFERARSHGFRIARPGGIFRFDA